MAERHVRPGEGGWHIETQSGPQGGSAEGSQEQAVARAEREVAGEGGGSVLIYNQDGKVRETRTVQADELGQVKNTVSEASEQAKGLAQDAVDRAKKAFGD
jgi:hypothetical protein